jgi:hypothetical protein
LSAVEDAGELIATVGIGTEEIDFCVGSTRAEQMSAGRNKSQEIVASASFEELERDDRGGVFFELIERAFARSKRVEKWTKVYVTSCINDVEMHGRKVGVLAVLLDGIIGREESRGRYDAMKRY